MTAKPRRKHGSWGIAIRRIFFEDDLGLWIVIALLARNDLPYGDAFYRTRAILLCATMRLLIKWIGYGVRDPARLVKPI